MHGTISKSLIALILLSRATAQETLESHLGKGYDALRQERYEVAAAEFRDALRLDPKLVMRARFPLAVALFELKQAAEARREFDTVRLEIGEQPGIMYYLGRLDIQEQNFESAIRNLNIAAVKPPFPDTAYYLGLACLKQSDLAEAEKWLRKAVEINPTDSLAQYQLGITYRKEGREDDASRAFALSGAIRQRDAEQSRLRTDCAEKLDHASRVEARAFCQQLYDPDNAEKLTTLGSIYGQHGDFDDALVPLKRAAELAPQTPQMQYNLAWTYFQMGRFEEARVPLAAAVERWPDLFPVTVLYGAVLVKLGEARPAYDALTRAHKLKPEDPGTNAMLYQVSLELARRSKGDGDYPEAIRYLEEAAKLRPEEAQPHRELADIYILTGHRSDADLQQQQIDRLDKKRQAVH